MVELADWHGLVSERTNDYDGLQLVAMVAPGSRSWASPFRVVANDRNGYFVKTLESCSRDWARGSLAVEYIVAQAGKLIGAPVCDTSLILIPEEFRGGEIRRGLPLVPGIAHASKALQHADERRDNLAYRNRDDNRVRHVGVYALYDWCWGSDAQWLHDVDNDQSIYSHDHGLYLPPNDGRIDSKFLQLSADEPNELPDSPAGLDGEAVEEVAEALEKIDRDALVNILCAVPASWPVTDEALATLGWFLEYRAPAVASRLRALV
ncbi:hypothetical protein [Sphaerisporangium dianthi]|uniref:Phosphatidylinositol kinase n=1 Tax=Sphaerisporangium dianthi TaxID=1436120 RepID=A0ABV9CRK3_9ACTN